MQRAPVPSPTPQAEAPARPLYRFPDDAFTPEELALFDERDPVDPEAALAWLEGTGPDPWGGSSKP